MTTPAPAKIETLLKLYAPKEVGVTLVPLQDVEQSDDTSFWASVFFALLFAFGGALIPLGFTDFKNQPMVIIVAAMALLFLVLFICFTCKARGIRKKMRAMAIGPTAPTDDEETISQEEAQSLKGFTTMSYALHKHVFRGAPTLLKDQFMKRVPQMFDKPIDASQAQDVYEDFLKMGMIEAFESDTKSMYVRPSLTALENIGLQDVKLTINRA